MIDITTRRRLRAVGLGLGAASVSIAIGAPGDWPWKFAVAGTLLTTFSGFIPVGDETTVEKVTDALYKASPENIQHAIEHREDAPPEAPSTTPPAKP